MWTVDIKITIFLVFEKIACTRYQESVIARTNALKPESIFAWQVRSQLFRQNSIVPLRRVVFNKFFRFWKMTEKSLVPRILESVMVQRNALKTGQYFYGTRQRCIVSPAEVFCYTFFSFEEMIKTARVPRWQESAGGRCEASNQDYKFFSFWENSLYPGSRSQSKTNALKPQSIFEWHVRSLLFRQNIIVPLQRVVLNKCFSFWEMTKKLLVPRNLESVMLQTNALTTGQYFYWIRQRYIVSPAQVFWCIFFSFDEMIKTALVPRWQESAGGRCEASISRLQIF